MSKKSRSNIFMKGISPFKLEGKSDKLINTSKYNKKCFKCQMHEYIATDFPDRRVMTNVEKVVDEESSESREK